MLGDLHKIEKDNNENCKLTRQEWFENINVFYRIDGSFIKMDPNEATRKYEEQLTTIKRLNFFHFNLKGFLNEYNKGKYQWIDDFTSGTFKSPDQKEQLGDLDSGKNRKITKQIKLNNKEEKKKENQLIENAKSLYMRFLLLGLYTNCEFDTMKECFEWLNNKQNKNAQQRKEEYLDALFVDTELYQTQEMNIKQVEEFYQFDADSYLDGQLASFNIQIRQLLEKAKEDPIMIQNIINIIGNYLKPSMTEKKSKGEVFTPFSLIEQMLGKLPTEVWSNPNLKWLDPANGIGNFPAVIVQKLMEGLKEWEPDAGKRRKHILENMLYVCDIQPKNMFLYLLIFDNQNHYKMNWHRGSYLDSDFNKKMSEWGVDKFDIIVGNPPYQDSSKKDKLGGKEPLWIQFVNKVFTHLKQDGYLVFVHPSLWRQCDDEKCSILRKKNMIFLSINNEKIGLNTFKAETRFDWHITQNCSYKGQTNILDEELKINKIDLNSNKWKRFIPNSNFDTLSMLLPSETEKCCEILYERSMYGSDKKWMSKEKIDDFKHPCLYSIGKEGNKTLFFCNEKKGHFGQTKVVVPPGRISSVNVYADINGEYGLMQFCWGIKCSKSEVEMIAKAMNSEKFKKIAYACSVSKLEYNRKIIGTFKKDFWKEFV
ncbi:MAG: Eco57I restriction-modification methylase domain-containing protein [Candidatus Woesearchaeota archaeon]|jgi:hypothetical protein